jgi:ribosome-binding protein aMBF1 (putative translation factor)
VNDHHGRDAAGWVLSGATAARAGRGVRVRLSAVNIERVRAAADALFGELTEPAAVQGDDEDWLHLLGSWVRADRERAGLTQAALAEIAGMEESTVARCEAGKREMTA